MAKSNKDDFKDFIEDKKSNNSKFVLVNNNLKYFVGCPVKLEDKGKVGGYTTKNIVLYPGFNEVRLNIWDKAQTHPFFKWHLDEDNIIYNGEKGFFDIDKKKQIKIAAKIFDKTLIINLKNKCNDQDVLAALNQQFDKIHGTRIMK